MKDYQTVYIPISVLIFMLGFFLKASYNQFSEMAKSIASLNEKVGIILNDHQHLNQRVLKVEEDVTRVWKNFDSMRENTHTIRNSLGQMELNKEEISKTRDRIHELSSIIQNKAGL